MTPQRNNPLSDLFLKINGVKYIAYIAKVTEAVSHLLLLTVLHQSATLSLDSKVGLSVMTTFI